jgi:hypothetical protein
MWLFLTFLHESTNFLELEKPASVANLDSSPKSSFEMAVVRPHSIRPQRGRVKMRKVGAYTLITVVI